MALHSFFSDASESAALARACAQGAVLIALVWAVFRLVPRIPAAARCLVWWLLCLKMLVGLMWFAAPVTLAVLPTKPKLAASPPQPSRSGREKTFSSGTQEPSTLLPPASGGLGWASERVSLDAPWPLLRAFWLCGIGVFLTLLAAQFLKAARLRRDAHIAPPGRCWDAISSAAKALGVTHCPPVLLSLFAHSPMTAGLFKPVVLLPGKDAFTLSDDELLMVLAHETAHIRRRDLWFGLVPAVTQAVFFFHPLVWLAHREYLLAREEACDALALRATNLPADQYGRLLLRFGTVRGGAGAAVAITGSQAVHALRRRLSMLHTVRPLTVRQQWTWAAGLCVFGVLCVTPVALTERTTRPLRLTHSQSEKLARVEPLAVHSGVFKHAQARCLTLRRVAPETLKRVVQVADARLSPMQSSAPHLAQSVEIRELPTGIVQQAPPVPPAPPAP